MFSVRAVVIDHYISKINHEWYQENKSNFNKHWLEPVIRIYGSTPEGLKSCIHVHGVYPYMYVPCKGGDNVDQDALILGAALDEALKMTYNQHKTKFIHKVCVTSGMPLYGYHSTYRLFYKIYFYNPYHIKKASELLLNGAILNQKLQPHEAHIPYVLQFMIDYNIYGMSFVVFSKIKYRNNPQNSELLGKTGAQGEVCSSRLKKMTCSYLEADAFATDITNRNASRSLSSNPGLRGIWESEKIRRKKQNLPSQFTAEESLSREPFEPPPTEKMYKERLACKLRDTVLVEINDAKTSEEPEMIYPAETPSDKCLLEASAIIDDLNHVSVKINDNFDISVFIDEKVVSQQMEQAIAEDAEGIEDESILGKNQKEGAEGAELENEEDEDDDGGDMTQPLDVDEEEQVAAGCGLRSNTENQETQFWFEMGDKILQIDGAQDSSSDSDVASALKTTVAETPASNCFLLGRDFTEGSESARCVQAVESSETTIIARNSSIGGGGSILTLLPDNGTPAVPLILSQPLSAIWSGFAQRPDCPLAAPPNQTLESWSWDKNEIPFSDLYVPRSQVVSACDLAEAVGSKSSEDSNSDESLRSLLGSNHFFDNYDGMPSMGSCNSIASSYSGSSPASVFPSPARFETYADVNMNSVASESSELYDPAYSFKQNSTFITPTKYKSAEPSSPSASKEKQQIKSPAKPSCKSVSLALKQYFKNLGELVNVDLKTFNDREMVVIEYKPFDASVTGQNKIMIKPLDRILENWSSTEKNVVEESSKSKKLRTNVLESEVSKSTETNNRDSNLFKNSSSNRSTNLKSKAIGGLVRNQEKEAFPANAISKILKSRTRKQKNNAVTTATNFQCRSCNSRKSKTIDGRNANDSDHLKHIECKNKLNELILNNWKEGPANSGRKKDSNLTRKSKKNNEETGDVKTNSECEDIRLIKQINSCFEDYFRKVVKVNNVWNENGNNLNWNGRDSGADDAKVKKVRSSPEDHSKRTSGSTEEKAEEDSESVKMVAQLLSAFSKMSRTRDMPPLHITINIGNRGYSNSDSVRLDFPNPTNAVKCKRGRSKKSSSQLGRFKISNVDGPADNSSSEDSLESLPSEKRKTGRALKKLKKDGHYKSLNIILQKTAPKTRKGSNERKRKRSVHPDADERKEEVSCRRDSSHFSENQLSLEDRLESSNKEKESLKTCSTNIKSDSATTPSASSKVSTLLTTSVCNNECKEEPDIIYDSEEDFRPVTLTLNRKTRKSLKLKKKNSSRTKRSQDSVGSCESEKMKEKIEITEVVDVDDVASAKVVAAVEETIIESPSRLDSVFDMSLSELDKTRYRIPSKWFDTKTKALTSTLGTCQPGKEISKDPSPMEMSLSGSPLCSPAISRSASSFGSQNSRENDRTPVPDEFCDSPSCSSATLKPDELSSGGFFSEAEDTFQTSQIISLTESKVVRPRRKPPTWDQVQSFLIANEHIKEEIQVPFYSDPRDLTKAMETGPLILKIETTAYPGLKPFTSSLNLVGTELRRRLLLNIEEEEEFRHLLVADRDVVITPLKKPPTTFDLMKNFKSNKAKKESEKIKAKVAVDVPLSPGQESHSDEEMDINLSLITSTEETRLELEESSSKCSGETANQSRLKSQSSGESIKGISRHSSSPCLEIKELARQESVPLIDSKELSAIKTPASSSSNESNSVLNLKGHKSSENSFQIRGPTLETTFGFNNSVENLQNAKPEQTYQHITLLVMELHVQTRENLLPDPFHDSIRALFYSVTFDSPNRKEETGVVVVGDLPLTGSFLTVHAVHRVPKEIDLILKIVDLIKDWDPDILAGYEIEMHSWGYLIQRAFVFQLSLFSMLGRIVGEQSDGGKPPLEKDESDDVPSSIKNMRIPGRIVLDIWRVLRHEVSLTSYTFENVMYHLSHERHPLLSHRDLSFYWDHPTHCYRHITFDYYLTRVTGIVRILDRLDFISRTSEFARLFGIQFYEVLSRGSQFRVESMMLRMAKPLNYVAVSPSVGQRASMRAPASLPLIMEPESAFYTDPVIVLDFQSLYPSMIIAYNYCFSTCLGRVEKLGGRKPFEFGCTQLQISPEELKALENDITISPAGVVFVKENVKKGILPTMLEQILEARLMVKKSMKNNKNDKLLGKVLFAQQLGLKLIANVTYGYTAANFSGRMPSIEVGDSVVSKGRETLERAIHLVKNNPKWNARVVYGDTDSVFVLTPGRTRSEAFQIGAEISEAVTRDNPKPVKLKLEKVYQPSILQTKKRYVGYMYESPDQTKPVFEAKGIETVRRDGCPAVGKILQKALEILFETKDVSLVKRYTQRQFSKLFQGRVNLQDLIFAKEYRGRNGYRPGACVPALQLARQWTRLDKRNEPRVKERVPYVIVSGPPGVPLIKLVRSPLDLILDSGLHVNAFYYITKAIIPPLHRCFSLIGVDVMTWYTQMPKKFIKRYKADLPRDVKRTTISQYFTTVECLVCSSITTAPVCQECVVRPQVYVVTLADKIARWEKCFSEIAKICQSCCKSPKEFDCRSMDCPVLFRKTQASRDLLQIGPIRDILVNGIGNGRGGCVEIEELPLDNSIEQTS